MSTCLMDFQDLHFNTLQDRRKAQNINSMLMFAECLIDDNQTMCDGTEWTDGDYSSMCVSGSYSGTAEICSYDMSLAWRPTSQEEVRKLRRLLQSSSFSFNLTNSNSAINASSDSLMSESSSATAIKRAFYAQTYCIPASCRMVLRDNIDLVFFEEFMFVPPYNVDWSSTLACEDLENLPISPSKGLSSGVIAGIAIGSLVSCCVLICFCCKMCFKKEPHGSFQAM